MLDSLDDIGPAELLKRHADLLRKIESFSHVGHWRINLVDNTIFWSDEIYRIHGVTKDEYKPDFDSMIAFYHPDDRNDVKTCIKTSIETHAGFNLGKRIICPDGAMRYIVSHGECELDPGGNIVALFGTLKDVTDIEEKHIEALEALSFLQRMVDSTPDLIFVKDEKLRVVFANKAFLGLYGAPAEKVIGRTTFEKFPDQQAKTFMEQDIRALAEGYSETEEDITDYKGDTQTYLTRKQAFENQNGEKFLLGIAANITDQRKEENILRKIYQISADKGFSLEARIHEILRLSCDYYDLPYGIVSQIRGDYYHVLNVYDGEGKIKSGDVFSYKDTYCAFTFKADNVQSFDNAGESEIADHPCYTKFQLNSYIGIPLYVHGERYGTVNFSGPHPREKLFSDNDYAFIRMISHWIGHELTEAQYMARLKESEERYELAAKGSASALWDWDVKNDKLYWTGAVLSVLGYESADELPQVSIDFSDLVHPDDQDCLRQTMATHFKERTPFELELRVKRRNGQYIWTYNRAQAQWDYSGMAVRMCGSMTDINDRKTMEEELRRSNEELEQYAGIVSHDLHQPLRAIQGFLELLELTSGDKLDAKAMEYIGSATSAAEHLSVIIDELLEYSRFNKGVMELSDVDSDQIIKDIEDMLQPLVDSCGGTMEITGDFPVIQYDEKQFVRLMTNLIENGIKYASEDAPLIKITVSDDTTDWRFSVADNGIGIKRQYLDSIFDMFTRLKTKKGVDGTGIGLAVCRKIVEGHGGKIWVESEEDRGATFHFTVPKND